MAHHRLPHPPPSLLLHFLIASILLDAAPNLSAAAGFAVDGTVLELDESNFDSAISSFDFILVDFYAPWCGHCKRLAPELDKAAPILAGQKEPVVIAKINADKYTKLASKYGIDGYPTLKIFIHGIPINYTGPRKAELIVQKLRKFTAPDVAILEKDFAVNEFVEKVGTDFPIFIGFGLNESFISVFGKKYKAKAWFSVAKDFSEEVMVKYDFDKVPALVSFHPKYNEHSVFYGPFDGRFSEEYIQQNLLPLVVPINYETLKLLYDDERKIALTFVDDQFSEDTMRLIKLIKAAASANRDLVFAHAGLKQWEEFAHTFEIKEAKHPKIVIWNGREEYYIDNDLGSLDDNGDHGSQITWFLQAYRDGKLLHKRLKEPSVIGFLTQKTTLYMIAFVVVLLMLLLYMASLDSTDSRPRPRDDASGSSSIQTERDEYHPDAKQD